MLLKSPGFTAVAVLTLALGIGANTAIFSVVNAVLLRPLPYPESSRLVLLGEASEQIPDMSIAMANFNDWRAQNTVFENMAAYQGDNTVLTGRGEPERLRLRRITAGFFPTLRVQPILGRALAASDDKVGAQPVVLLGEGFWQRRFGGDHEVIGRQLILDGETFTVIGVLPRRLHPSLRQTDVFTSLWRLEDKLGGESRRGEHPGIYGYARLKSGVSLEQARFEMRSIAQRLAQQHPQDNSGHSVNVQPLLGAIVEDVRPSLLLLMGAVGFVLLIACANLANLLLARTTERQREIAVRIALGAGKSRIIRQLLTESVLLSLVGGTLGLLLAVWITAALAGSRVTGVPRMDEVSPDAAVLLFTLGMSVLTGFFFGMIPAMQAWRTDVQSTLKESGHGGGGSRARHRLREGLLAAEVALSLVLLVGAGLMTKSLYRVVRADAGVNPANVLTARLSLPELKYNDETKIRNFSNQLVAKIQALPGVELAGLKSPLFGGRQWGFVIDGRPIPPPQQMPSMDVGRVTPDALQAMGIRLIRGRYFDAHDDENAEKVCIIDETFARQYFPGEDPIGKRIRPGEHADEKPKWMTIVGVVAHVKNYGVDQPSRVESYAPQAQNAFGGGTLVIRSAADPRILSQGLREALGSLDPDVPLFEVRSLEEIISENSASRRLSTLLISSFTLLALVLAAVGIYGVMSYSVSQRSHEVGIRMALGADESRVLRMILREGVRLAILGIAAGLLAAVGLARLMTTVLFQVGSLDASIYALSAALAMLVVLLASFVPARRATRVDPLVSLRYE